jgi:hypothetical protein
MKELVVGYNSRSRKKLKGLMDVLKKTNENVCYIYTVLFTFYLEALSYLNFR